MRIRASDVSRGCNQLFDFGGPIERDSFRPFRNKLVGVEQAVALDI
jgi:hypothetical protein